MQGSRKENVLSGAEKLVFCIDHINFISPLRKNPIQVYENDYSPIVTFELIYNVMELLYSCCEIL